MQKVKPWRSKKYMKWVESLHSRVSMMPADYSHHIIDVIKSGTGTKPHDLFTMPLTHGEHSELHHVGGRKWDKDSDESQAEMVLDTINKALDAGVIEINWIG